ncbi:hypothetical protein CH63R_06273 [Colletotrichum higginsianum IMI 349063]|uniref:Uncharacterized protein n=1 Tax=Colletotrichum higginsianum (strain IMI 349063) TaxID=759273 RepID=A0A1B7YEK7_COLHI|nr:hypothetical protein CH63R_06273 [Colletotrichum higginsianum IMI 349063]OBR10581.1 hypothetical protein CH63R_06273 [Colletotrichum higginsianum IMI 349063]
MADKKDEPGCRKLRARTRARVRLFGAGHLPTNVRERGVQAKEVGTNTSYTTRLGGIALGPGHVAWRAKWNMEWEL